MVYSCQTGPISSMVVALSPSWLRGCSDAPMSFKSSLDYNPFGWIYALICHVWLIIISIHCELSGSTQRLRRTTNARWPAPRASARFEQVYTTGLALARPAGKIFRDFLPSGRRNCKAAPQGKDAERASSTWYHGRHADDRPLGACSRA